MGSLFTLSREDPLSTSPCLVQPKLSKSLCLVGSTAERAQREYYMWIVLVSDFASVLNSYTNESNAESDSVTFYMQFIETIFQ